MYQSPARGLGNTDACSSGACRRGTVRGRLDPRTLPHASEHQYRAQYSETCQKTGHRQYCMSYDVSVMALCHSMIMLRGTIPHTHNGR